MVHVAHDHHHGGAGLQILLLVLGHVDELFLNGDNDFLLHLAAQLHGHQGGGVIVDDVGQGSHDAVADEALDHLGPGLFHPGGQLAHADLIGDLHGERGLLGDLQLEAAHFLRFLLLALAAEVLVPVLIVPVLELLLSGLHPVGLVRGQVLQPLVVFLQVHAAALAGVHHLLLGGALGGSGGLGLVLLLLALGCGSGLVLLLGGGLALLPVGLPGLLPLGGGSGLLGLCRLVVYVGVDGFDGIHLVVLGQMLENDGQLPVRQDLRGGYRLFGVFG